MENLNEKVYECTLAVEAHMICDLLSQAGIPAQVVGAFLSGAGGELPLGNTVKVCVAPERAVEARQVIAEWEKLQTGDVVPPVTAQGRVRGLFWFGVGMVCGAVGAIVAMSMLKQPSITGVDYNGDGRDDTVHMQIGSLPGMTTMDRNLDGVYDVQWNFDSKGFESTMIADDDFDGRFEWSSEIENGEIYRSFLDADGDERPEQVWNFEHGVICRIDYYFASGGRIVKHEFYKAGLLDAADYDDDGDGVFERRVKFDNHADPVL